MSSAGQVTGPPFLFGIVLTQRNETLVRWGKGWTDHPPVPACGLFLTWPEGKPRTSFQNPPISHNLDVSGIDASHCVNFMLIFNCHALPSDPGLLGGC